MPWPIQDHVQLSYYRELETVPLLLARTTKGNLISIHLKKILREGSAFSSCLNLEKNQFWYTQRYRKTLEISRSTEGLVERGLQPPTLLKII